MASLQHAQPVQALPNDGCEAIGAEVLACLKLGAWPQDPAALERRAAVASDSQVGGSGESDDGEAVVEYRPRKVRVVCSDLDGTPQALQRRPYTWRGVCSRRAAKQQRALDALQQQQQQQQQQQAGAASPTHSSGSADSVPEDQAAAASAALDAAASCSSSKEGDREFAALTTWLRMNVHNPRTAKKVVLFVGARDAGSGCWAFRLNPALAWAELSPETRQRLRYLPTEAKQAFCRKYPGRAPEDWRLKSQKYKQPGSSQTHLVSLADFVESLHAVWREHEGGSSDDAAAEGQASAAPTPSGAHSAAGAAGAAAAELTSCGSSAQAAPAAAAQQ